jgi:multiple sugar transport system permease protein
LNRTTANRGAPWLWVAPWLVGFVLFMLVPTLMSLYYSFTDYSLLEPPVGIGLANFAELWRDPLFWRAIRNTAYYASVSVALGTVLAFLIALLLESHVKGRGLARAMIFLPTLVPLVAASLAWAFMYNPEAGLFNRALSSIGLSKVNWLGDARWAMPALIIMGFWNIGTAMVVYSAALRDVPRSLYEAADIDGVSRLRRLWHISIPAIAPAILFNVMISIIWSLQVFGAPQIMTEGGPDHSTYVYQLYIYESAFRYGRMGYASALAWVQLLATIGIAGLTLALSRKLVHYRGGA